MSDKNDANWLYRKLLADTVVKLYQGNIKLPEMEKLTPTINRRDALEWLRRIPSDLPKDKEGLTMKVVH